MRKTLREKFLALQTVWQQSLWERLSKLIWEDLWALKDKSDDLVDDLKKAWWEKEDWKIKLGDLSDENIKKLTDLIKERITEKSLSKANKIWDEILKELWIELELNPREKAEFIKRITNLEITENKIEEKEIVIDVRATIEWMNLNNKSIKALLQSNIDTKWKLNIQWIIPLLINISKDSLEDYKEVLSLLEKLKELYNDDFNSKVLVASIESLKRDAEKVKAWETNLDATFKNTNNDGVKTEEQKQNEDETQDNINQKVFEWDSKFKSDRNKAETELKENESNLDKMWAVTTNAIVDWTKATADSIWTGNSDVTTIIAEVQEAWKSQILSKESSEKLIEWLSKLNKNWSNSNDWATKIVEALNEGIIKTDNALNSPEWVFEKIIVANDTAIKKALIWNEADLLSYSKVVAQVAPERWEPLDPSKVTKLDPKLVEKENKKIVAILNSSPTTYRLSLDDRKYLPDWLKVQVEDKIFINYNSSTWWKILIPEENSSNSYEILFTENWKESPKITVTREERKQFVNNIRVAEAIREFKTFFEDINLPSVWKYRRELLTSMNSLDVNYLNPNTRLLNFWNEILKIIYWKDAPKCNDVTSLRKALLNFSKGNWVLAKEEFATSSWYDYFEALLRKDNKVIQSDWSFNYSTLSDNLKSSEWKWLN